MRLQLNITVSLTAVTIFRCYSSAESILQVIILEPLPFTAAYISERKSLSKISAWFLFNSGQGQSLPTWVSHPHLPLMQTVWRVWDCRQFTQHLNHAILFVLLITTVWKFWSQQKNLGCKWSVRLLNLHQKPKGKRKLKWKFNAYFISN